MDSLKQCGLVDDALSFAIGVLADDGCFVAKVRQGGGQSDLLARAKRHFAFVDVAKPAASRSESAEVYMVCKGFHHDTVTLT